MSNKEIDKKLNIDTEGIVQYYADAHHNRYEATDYKVLDLLINKGYIKKQDTFLDYGCGKYRVGFYINHKIGCKCIGIEYNADVYLEGLHNIEKSRNKDLSILWMDAKKYELDTSENHIYFFNPFSIQTLHTVLNNVMNSYYENNREIYLYFYYPTDDYVSYLMRNDNLTFIEVINTKFLYNNNDRRENILVYKIEKS